MELDATETLHGASVRQPDILQGIPGGRLRRTQQVHKQITELQSDDENLWEAAVWEDINTTHQGDTVPIAAVHRRRRTRMQDKLRDQRHASHWQNKHPTQATVQMNLTHFWKGAAEGQQAQLPTPTQILAAVSQVGAGTLTQMADTSCLIKMTETVYEARTQEEATVQDLLDQWRKGGHGYVPDEKGDDTIRLRCKNVNSLSLFHPTKSKQRKLLNLHNRYQTDGACILEHGTNFWMAPDGFCSDDIFAAYQGTRVAVAHNVHKQHS